ncbi:PTS sugar transporter subunit IIA [Brevibacillus fulvus]|uniref:PTS system galactitol-specific IIA component n=1 Tax=Brevibacillus fulvus TaxID=1125967 RepID=A0A938XWE1_9BACL|nr:PTS sugar transporter subunit IIA [Brevibacillus fulvus]MBM7589151.1 PTS system galactitol-specific IIA component [Brevibacillus fulvus]
MSVREKELFPRLFTPELTFLNFVCKNSTDFFEKITDILLEKGYVKESFRQAIQERERCYPTGLRTAPYHVAIPHTDPETIRKPFIAVIRPQTALQFYEMGTNEETVEARLLFLLGLNRSEAQVPLLQIMMEMFADQQMMERLLQETSEQRLLNVLHQYVVGRSLS